VRGAAVVEDEDAGLGLAETAPGRLVAAVGPGPQPVGPEQPGEGQAADAEGLAAGDAVTQANAAAKEGEHGGFLTAMIRPWAWQGEFSRRVATGHYRTGRGCCPLKYWKKTGETNLDSEVLIVFGLGKVRFSTVPHTPCHPANLSETLAVSHRFLTLYFLLPWICHHPRHRQTAE
jgi:hypothetical protein